MKNMILKILIITLLSLSFIYSVSAGVYCLEPIQGYDTHYCAYLENVPFAESVCDVTSVTMPEECSPANVGCCCEGGDSIEYKNSCDPNYFDNTTKNEYLCQELCLDQETTTPDPTTCDPSEITNVNLIASHVKGIPNVQLSWSSCQPQSIVILRNSSEIASLGSGITSYRDTSTTWETSYRYEIRIAYSGSPLQTATTTIRTGHAVCEGSFDFNQFCAKSTAGVADFTDTYGTCSASNIYSSSGVCTGGTTCAVQNGVAVCLESSECDLANYFLGTSSRADCTGYCYYDRSNTGIDRCFDCDSAMSCFDYKTEGACEQNSCGISGCEWTGFNAELGTGICKANNVNYCNLTSRPWGNFNQDAYTPLLTPTTRSGDSSISVFFSTTVATCSDNTACLLALSCQNYDNNSDACKDNANICGAAIGGNSVGCNYLNNGRCTRVNTDTTMPCSTLSGTARAACELDYFAPHTSILARSFGNNVQFELTIYDQTVSNDEPKIIDSPYTRGYSTSICISEYAEGDCDTNTITYNQQSPNFDLIYLNNSFPGYLEANKTYFILVNSTDNTSNREPTRQRTSFKVPSVIEPLPPQAGYNFTLLSPKATIGQGVPFTIELQTTKSTSSCYYGIAGSVFNMTSLSPLKLAFSSSSLTRFTSFELTINCTSNDGEIAQNKFWIEAINQSEVISIRTLNFNPSRLVQQQNNAWRTTLNVETNIPSRCKYSWNPEASYANMLSSDGQNNNNLYSRTHNISIALSESITSPQNRTAYVICENSLLNANPKYSTKRNTTLMIHPNAPGSFWINIETPRTSNTIPPTYYNSTTVPYHITTAMPSTCNATVGNLNLNLAGIRTSWNGTFNVAVSETYTLRVNCMYGFDGQEREGIASRTFSVDAQPPFVAVNVPTNTTETYGFNFTTSYNDSISGVADAKYVVLRRSINISEVIVRTGTLPIQNVNDLNKTVLGPLLDNHAYKVNVSVMDAAGNLQSKLSNELVVNLPNACKNGYQNDGETDIDCGGLNCPSCSAGNSCNTNTDCATGFLCLAGNDGKVCAPATCNDNRKNDGETDIDCGPVCFKDCQEHIRLVRPQFGYTPSQTFTIEVSTYENSVCNYRNSNVPSGSYIPITSQSTKTHVVSNYQIAPGTTQDTITIICTSSTNITRERNFTLRLDPNAPVINTVTAIPNPITIKSFNAAESKTAYWSLVGAVIDKAAFCKYSLQSKPYGQMEYSLGSGVSENKSGDYAQTNSKHIGFDSQGNYNVYVACKGLNGLISEPKAISISVNENASLQPLVVSPPAGSTLNSRNVIVSVNPVYEATSCTVRLGTSQTVTPLARSGTRFINNLTVPSDGLHSINVTCSYPTSPFVRQGTVISSFKVDSIGPNVTRASAMDPYTRNTTVTIYPTAVRIDVNANDETSGVSRIYYTVNVNNQNVSQGSRSVNVNNNVSTTFYDNNLNLQNNDNVVVRVSAGDFAGNNGTSRNTNTLRYSQIALPVTCTDGIKNGNETGIDCGGSCQACAQDLTCKNDADCQSGLTCLSGKCIPRIDVCRNNVFDSEFESDVDCGGDCPTCDLGSECNENADCASGLFCSDLTDKCELDVDLICNNNKFDTGYESDVDCGGICAIQLNMSCPSGDSCRQQSDCSVGNTCTNGQCAPAKNIPTYCLSNTHNNTINTTNGTIYCGFQCDRLCTAGAGCTYDQDCSSGLRCEERGNARFCVVPTGADTCNPSDPLSSCGGTCERSCALGSTCNTNSDCSTGLTCNNNKCVSSQTTGGPTTIAKPEGDVGQPCFEGGTCLDDLRCNKDFICEEKTGVSWIRIVLFIILIALLGGIGYYAYITYYQPKDKKPDFLKNKGGMNNSQGKIPGTDITLTPLPPMNMEGNTHTIMPPTGPVVPSSPKVDALLERKRMDEKKEERSKLFGAFDDSALNDDTLESDKPVKNVLKNVPKADFDEKPPVPVRSQSSERTFKDILDEAKKEVASEEKKKVSKVQSKSGIKKEVSSEKKDTTKEKTSTSKKESENKGAKK